MLSLPHALRALKNPEVRRFFAGQGISVIGTWMQSVALGWLVYRLTRSTEMLGLVAFLQQVPVFLFGLQGGALADRLPRKKVIIVAQATALVQAALLATITLTGVVKPWHLLPLAVVIGVVNAFEIPARQSLIGELAGPDMPNAVALNSMMVNLARLVGPLLAGLCVAAFGEGVCFALNAVSYLAVLAALWKMNVVEERPPTGRTAGHLQEGLRYAARTPWVRTLLALLACTAFFLMPYSSMMPAIAAEVLGGGPSLLGQLYASAGLGATLGAAGLILRTDLRGLGRRLGLGATMFGAALLGMSLTRSVPLASGFLVLAGFGFITQVTATTTLLQALAPRALRGRVLGLHSVLFVGVVPFGALSAGALAGSLGVQGVLRVGAVVALVASAAYHLMLPALRARIASEHAELHPAQVP